MGIKRAAVCMTLMKGDAIINLIRGRKIWLVFVPETATPFLPSMVCHRPTGAQTSPRLQPQLMSRKYFIYDVYYIILIVASLSDPYIY
jgi:hypothetical protein